MDRVLLISNERAGSVSDRAKQVIAKALSADFKLEVADTVRRDHATELSDHAVRDGYDAVVVFGGDGTINEAAQPLVGTEVALGVLPGGSTNVIARSLGVPSDPIDATAFVAGRLRSKSRRRINVGRFRDRFFLFSAGMGLDAEVVKRVEADPEGKERYGEWSFVSKALRAAITQYRAKEPRIELTVEGHESDKVLLVVCCNARPFTYLGRFPVDACPQASLDGRLDVLAFTRIGLDTIPRLVWSLFVSRSHVGWRNSRYHHDVGGLEVVAELPLPVQVDGDFIGEQTGGPLASVPNALDVLF